MKKAKLKDIEIYSLDAAGLNKVPLIEESQKKYPWTGVYDLILKDHVLSIQAGSCGVRIGIDGQFQDEIEIYDDELEQLKEFMNRD